MQQIAFPCGSRGAVHILMRILPSTPLASKDWAQALTLLCSSDVSHILILLTGKLLIYWKGKPDHTQLSHKILYHKVN